MKRRLTQLNGFVAEGDVFAVDWAVSEGRFPRLINERQWKIPEPYKFDLGPERIVLTDELGGFEPGVAYLRPPSLVAGIHPAREASSTAIEALLVDALASASLARSSLTLVATVAHSRNDRSLRRLGYPLRAFDSPSCSATALAAAGAGSSLVVREHKSAAGTISVARRDSSRHRQSFRADQ